MGVVYFSIIPTFEPSRYCKCWIVCFYDKLFLCQLYQGNAHINIASLPFSFIIVPNLIYNDQHVMYFNAH